MKRFVSVVLIVFMALSFSACDLLNYQQNDLEEAERLEAERLENAQKYYDNVIKSKALLDVVAADICAMWKDAKYDVTTKELNKSIAKIQETHQEKIDEIARLDAEIEELFTSAKLSQKAGTYVAIVMLEYFEYRDSVIKVDASHTTYGHIEISSNKETLERYLNQLYVIIK